MFINQQPQLGYEILSFEKYLFTLQALLEMLPGLCFLFTSVFYDILYRN